MRIASIRPSTVDGIKQLAKKIKREQNVSHTAALDLASRQAGYENFVHARHQLSVPRVFPVYMTVHWVAPRGERTPGAPWAGREMLRVDLSRPLPEVIAKHRVSEARGLEPFRMEYADHLEHLTNVSGQDGAHRRLLAAARSLRFMEVTGLQPVTIQAMREQANALRELPGRDHTSAWFDPATNAVLLLDEPYRASVVRQAQERAGWAATNGNRLLAPEWEGIYYPGECVPHLVSKDAALVERVAAALSTLPPQIVPEPWPFPAGRNGEDFVSPQREADGKPRKPRPGPSYRDYMGATPYGGGAGIPSSWRPKQAMAVELHHRLGVLMQGLSEIGFSHRVDLKLTRVRANLEDWMGHEHGGPATDGVYYGGPHRPLLSTPEERLKALAEARAIVERGYNECKPRRELIAVLDEAAADVGRRAPA